MPQLDLLPDSPAAPQEDAADRAAWREKLRLRLQDPAFRQLPGFPQATDEAILALSDPPYYTACPNPFLPEILEEWGNEKWEMRNEESESADPKSKIQNPKLYHRDPFAADVSEGKNDPIYNAHSYHTKVPHKAIMRYILHYTDPGDIVLDGFCGTGMTGVAAQLCGDQKAVESLGYQVAEDGSVCGASHVVCGEAVGGPCTLRRAVLESEKIAAAYRDGQIANPFPILIRFDLPNSESHNGAGLYWTIQLTETGELDALPRLGEQTALIGETQNGRSDGPTVIVRGPEKVPAGYGLIVDSDSLISGLAFQRLRMHLQLNGGGNIVENNWFGLTDDGLDIHLRDPEHPEDGSGQSGVTTTENIAHNLIQDNVLAGFRGGAVSFGSNDSYFQGNYVGVNADGVIPVDITYNRVCMPNARYYNWFGGAGVDVYGQRDVSLGDGRREGDFVEREPLRRHGERAAHDHHCRRRW